MNKVGFIYHDDFLKHWMPPGHPECKERLIAIRSHLDETGLINQLNIIQPRPAEKEEICSVHDERYVDGIIEFCRQGGGSLDPDTSAGPDSGRAAFLAAGAAITAVDEVVSANVSSCFCAVRPPGHHAEADRAMGFCLFNNIAVAAAYAIEEKELPKVAIVDWDVHHGNGTQHMFYDNPKILYISLHQYPHYPGTGSAMETGQGNGEGTTLNIPMASGSGDGEYLEAFEKVVVPSINEFAPSLLLISAGFDAHVEDPLSMINLSDESFGSMTEMLKECARPCCEGRIVSMLEGGYNLDALSRGVEAHLRVLLDE
jgi:acetoin utilization deacetylase AcuC-like enzyme